MCGSKFTIDRRTGEALSCSSNHLKGNIMRPDWENVHTAEYAGLTWTWYTSEEDKSD